MKIFHLYNPALQLSQIWQHEESVVLAEASRFRGVFREIRDIDLPLRRPHILLASSGTSGEFKLVALSRKALLTSAAQVNRSLEVCKTDVWLNPLPCYHVGGFSIHVRAELSGSRVIYLQKWQAGDFVREAQHHCVTLTSLVPTQVYDLVSAKRRSPPSFRAVVVGGGALDDRLYEEAMELGWPLLRSYGLTEAASQVATESFRETAQRGGLRLLDHFDARVDEGGVLELCGPSLLTGWIILGNNRKARWVDPKRDGWFRTSDRVQLRGRELRVLGRVDDLVKIRGELVDVAALERALQSRVTSGAVMLRVVPDERNGAALHITAESEEAAREARQAQDEVFPSYARPGEILTGVIERTALGKIVRL